MNLVHYFGDAERSHDCVPLELTVLIDAPPSIVLGAIDRYFDTRNNLLDLILPMEESSGPEFIAVDVKVAVKHEDHPNRALIARYDDRLVVQLCTIAEDRPVLTGRFTIKPCGTGTELLLKGHATIMDRGDVAKGIGILMQDLKVVVETEFEMLKAVCRPVERMGTHRRGNKTVAATLALIALCIAVLCSRLVSVAAVNYPAGSTIDATLQQEINTKTAQDGQRFTMVTASGSKIYGHLAEVVAATPTRKAHVKFAFDLIQFSDGARAPLHATLAGITQKKSINYTQAAGEALGGMIVGNILGKKIGTNAGGLLGLAGGALLATNTSYNIDIPAGAAARISLTAPLAVGHPQAG